MDKGDGKKVRFVRHNERTYTVGGGRGVMPAMKNGLKWQSGGGAQTNDERYNYDAYHAMSNGSQQQQQQQQRSELSQHEQADSGGQFTRSTEISSSAAVVGDGGSVPGPSCASLMPASVGATSHTGAVTSLTDLTTVTSWSAEQAWETTTSGWMCPYTVPQPASGTACEAASLVQQIVTQHQVESQQHSGDQLIVFEDGLAHLRNMYESQLASSRSVCVKSAVYFAQWRAPGMG